MVTGAVGDEVVPESIGDSNPSEAAGEKGNWGQSHKD